MLKEIARSVKEEGLAKTLDLLFVPSSYFRDARKRIKSDEYSLKRKVGIVGMSVLCEATRIAIPVYAIYAIRETYLV